MNTVSLSLFFRENIAYLSGVAVLLMGSGFTVVFAQDLSKLNKLATDFGVVISNLTGAVIALLFLIFFWKLIGHIRSDDPTDAKRIGSLGISLLIIIVVVSLWSIVGFVQNLLGIDDVQVPANITLPTVDNS